MRCQGSSAISEADLLFFLSHPHWHIWNNWTIFGSLAGHLGLTLVRFGEFSFRPRYPLALTQIEMMMDHRDKAYTRRSIWYLTFLDHEFVNETLGPPVRDRCDIDRKIIFEGVVQDGMECLWMSNWNGKKLMKSGDVGPESKTKGKARRMFSSHCSFLKSDSRYSKYATSLVTIQYQITATIFSQTALISIV